MITNDAQTEMNVSSLNNRIGTQSICTKMTAFAQLT